MKENLFVNESVQKLQSLDLNSELKYVLDTKRKIRKGFYEYDNIILDIENICSDNISEFKDDIEKSIRCLDDNYYKLLVYAVDVTGNNQSNSILNNAVVINKHINVNKFVEYLKYRLSIHENKYFFESNYRLVLCVKIFYTIDELIKLKHDDDDIKKINLRINENINDLIHKDKDKLKIDKSIKRFLNRNSIYKCLQWKLNPDIISKLDIINGSNSFCLYNVKINNHDILKTNDDYKLIEFLP